MRQRAHGNPVHARFGEFSHVLECDSSGCFGPNLVRRGVLAHLLDGLTHKGRAHVIEQYDIGVVRKRGAQFVQVRVDTATGEVRVDRMVGVFAAGRIVNPVTARSQFIGGMTMGLGMALHEAGIMDPQFGDYANNDLSQYHIPAHADVPAIEIGWIDEQDSQVNPLGVKGIGELGVVGTAAAIANAVWHATGVRYRTLPLTPSRVLQGTAG